MSKGYMIRSTKRRMTKGQRIRRKICLRANQLLSYWVESMKASFIATLLIIGLTALVLLALVTLTSSNKDEIIVISTPVPTAEITITAEKPESAQESEESVVEPTAEPTEIVEESTNPFDFLAASAEEQIHQEPVPAFAEEVETVYEPNALVYSDKGDFPPYVDWYKPDVELIQSRLTELGYYTGTIDGNFGPGTGKAVKAFQKAKGLTVDGIAGPATLSKMGIKNRMAYPNANYCYMANLSAAAAKSSSNYMIEIRYQNQRAYGGDGKPVMVLYQKKNGYWYLVKTVYCTPGRDGKTPLGVFAALRKGGTFSKDDGKTEWRNPTWFHDEKRPTKEDPKHIACFGIHSTGYNTTSGKYDNSVLGKRVSAGCVRVHPDVANWIYNHCPKGTTIVVNDR